MLETIWQCDSASHSAANVTIRRVNVARYSCSAGGRASIVRKQHPHVSGIASSGCLLSINTPYHKELVAELNYHGNWLKNSQRRVLCFNKCCHGDGLWHFDVIRTGTLQQLLSSQCAVNNQQVAIVSVCSAMTRTVGAGNWCEINSGHK
jgi:hypothetical protein